ncbi:MAG: glutamate racemase [Chloroflexota bacterium]
MIALFDSGLGGLSVLREVRSRLPQHDLLYLADTAYCPYGVRPDSFVQQRSLQIGRSLLDYGVRLLVVACNTASSAALEVLRAELPIPVVGMEPGLKPAIAATHNGSIGVLATSGTLAGERFARLVERFAHQQTVITQPCPGLVEQVERGTIDDPTTDELLKQYIEPLLTKGIDTLVLGCTHYPFLREPIVRLVGSGITIIDTGPAVARQVEHMTSKHNIVPGNAATDYFTTGNAESVTSTLKRLLGETITAQSIEII